VLKQIKLLVT